MEDFSGCADWVEIKPSVHHGQKVTPIWGTGCVSLTVCPCCCILNLETHSGLTATQISTLSTLVDFGLPKYKGIKCILQIILNWSCFSFGLITWKVDDKWNVMLWWMWGWYSPGDEHCLLTYRTICSSERKGSRYEMVNAEWTVFILYFSSINYHLKHTFIQHFHHTLFSHCWHSCQGHICFGDQTTGPLVSGTPAL